MMEFIDISENVEQRTNRAGITPIKFRHRLSSLKIMKTMDGSSTRKIMKKRRSTGIGVGVFRHRFSSPHKKKWYKSPSSKSSPGKRQWLKTVTTNQSTLDERGFRTEAAEPHLAHDHRPPMDSNPSTDTYVDNANLTHEQKNDKISSLESQVTSMEKDIGRWRCHYLSEQNECYELMNQVQQKDEEIHRLNEEARRNKERVDKILQNLNISGITSDIPASIPSGITQNQQSLGVLNSGNSDIHQNGTFMSKGALQSLSTAVAKSTVQAVTSALKERQTDFAYGSGLSGNQVDMMSRVLTNETSKETTERKEKEFQPGKNKRRKISKEVLKEAKTKDIVECVKTICDSMDIEQPFTIEAIEACERKGQQKNHKGFWCSVAAEWNERDESKKAKGTHLTTDLKSLYAEKMNILLKKPEGRPKPRELQADVDLPDGGKCSITFTAPVVPRSVKCRDNRNKHRRGNANPASGPGFSKLDLQKLQKIPQKLTDDRDNMIRAMEAADMSGKKASEVNWEHVIQTKFTADDGRITTLQDRHSGWENTTLLAYMFQRIYENRLESEVHKAFGEVPSDAEVRKWAFNEDCYIGQEVRFRHDDDTTVDMRVLHIRAVVLLFLQQCFIDGVLKKPDDPHEPREFKDVCNWKDATNAAKKSVCCCCYKLANDPSNFIPAKALLGTVPLMWAVSQNMSETKLNYDLVNTTDGLLHEYLKEPIQIHDMDGKVFATYDFSKWKSVIGDAHYNEVW